jgi:anti-sigma B factor antagonist
MQVTVEGQQSGAAIVRLAGRLDLLSAAEVRQQLMATVAAGHPHLVVDLADVEFMDSTGLGCLVSGLKVARLAGGDLRLARPPDQARTILQLTTLDRVLRPYDTTEEALAGYR